MSSGKSVKFKTSSNVIWVRLIGIQDEVGLNHYLRQLDKFVQQQAGRWGRIVDLRE